jgi:hypothetical protein
VNVRFNRGFELASYLDKGNVPNMSYETLDSELQILNYKWKKTDDTLEDTIDTAIDIRKQNIFHVFGHANKSSYLVATQKQLERRGEIGAFRGHR